MKIYNGTPHQICIFKEEDVYFDHTQRKLFVKEGAEPFLVIPPSQKLLNASIKYERAGDFQGIPIFKPSLEGIDPIPEGYDIVIVSALYASTAFQFNAEGLDRLYTISQPVYNDPDNPRPCGCLGLNKVK